jgi:hypothetical protein
MTRRQRRGLVEEEQLGELPRTEQFPAPTLEPEPAGDPSPDLPVADELPGLVVQDSAVPEQESPRFGRDDVPERRDPVAARHDAPHARR